MTKYNVRYRIVLDLTEYELQALSEAVVADSILALNAGGHPASKRVRRKLEAALRVVGREL